MEINKRMCNGLVVVVLIAVIFTVFMPAAAEGHVHHSFPPAPAPAPTSDGTTIDQGIACVLMLLALVLTYLIHTLEVPLNFQVI
ncbi:unnamed protein product [Coffea canephora]|uniref:Uncharacterized protein n=1 Tax=Coffea canephora TaxID=49390 RepID=A0A068UUM7_COFCA|nr:unnamed protein product [Coffea canephora]